MEKIIEHFGNPFEFHQLVGWIGLLFYIVSYQFKETRQTMKCYLPVNISYAIHHYGLGSLVLTAMSVGALFRNISGIWASDKVMRLMVVAYVVFAWVITFLFMQSEIEILAAIGTTCFSMSIWFRDNFLLSRLCVMGQQTLWFGMYMILGSYAGLVMMGMIFISNMIGIYRHKIQPKGEVDVC